MAKKLIVLALAVTWSLAPGLALAQDPDPIPVPSWITIPDLVGYVSWAVTPYVPVCEPEPTVVWNDPTSPFRWLAWRITSLFEELICFLLNVAQFFANLFAAGLNLLIFGLNEFWRFLVYTWLTIREWLLAMWDIVELLRDFWRMLEEAMLILVTWVWVLIELFLAGLVLVGQALLILLRIFGVMLNLITWIGMLMLGPLLALLGAFSSTAVPITITGTHPVYQAVRAVQEAILDSNFGFLMHLLHALCYVGFVYWAARFTSTRGAQ